MSTKIVNLYQGLLFLGLGCGKSCILFICLVTETGGQEKDFIFKVLMVILVWRREKMTITHIQA